MSGGNRFFLFRRLHFQNNLVDGFRQKIFHDHFDNGIAVYIDFTGIHFFHYVFQNGVLFLAQFSLRRMIQNDFHDGIGHAFASGIDRRIDIFFDRIHNGRLRRRIRLRLYVGRLTIRGIRHTHTRLRRRSIGITLRRFRPHIHSHSVRHSLRSGSVILSDGNRSFQHFVLFHHNVLGNLRRRLVAIKFGGGNRLADHDLLFTPYRNDQHNQKHNKRDQAQRHQSGQNPEQRRVDIPIKFFSENTYHI